MKRQKIILSSTHVDKHNDKNDKSVFEKVLPTLTGADRMRWLANHRRDLPPFGYISEVSIQEDGDHAYLVGETFPYEIRKEVDWDTSLFVEESSVLFPFLDKFKGEDDRFKISVDKNSFKSLDDISKVGIEIGKIFEEEITLAVHIRKAITNVPELILTLGTMHYVSKLIRPFTTKYLETLGEKGGEATASMIRKGLKIFGGALAKSFKLVWSKVTPKDKGMSLILEIPGDEFNPHVFLFIKADRPEDIQKGFNEKNVNAVRKITEDFMKYMAVAEITFMLNGKGHFTFRFLITKDGRCVGKKGIFKERDKLAQRIISSNNGITNFSVAGEIKSMSGSE